LPTDKEIFVLLTRSPREALELIYERFVGRILSSLCRRGWGREEVLDELGNVFVDIMGERLALPAGGSFGAWLYVVVWRKLVVKARRPSLALLGERDHPLVASTLDFLVELERMQILETAVERLTPSEREALVGHCFNGLSYEALADRVGISEGAIRKRVASARQKLLAAQARAER